MQTFTHRHFIDPHWRPAPGQKHSQGPKAQMRITRATRTMVWYTYLHDPGPAQWHMSRHDFEVQYPDVLPLL